MDLNNTEAQKYFFSDFTITNYYKLLSIASKHYSFNFFEQIIKLDSIILRHGLGLSLEIALRMAQIKDDVTNEADINK